MNSFWTEKFPTSFHLNIDILSKFIFFFQDIQIRVKMFYSGQGQGPQTFILLSERVEICMRIF